MSQVLQKLVIALTDGSLYALIALGYTMVYGVLRLINFAHGDVFMIGAFIGAYTAQFLSAALGHTAEADQAWWMAPLGIAAAMAVCGCVGFTIERVAYRPLRNAPKLSALITAIGVSLLIEYLLQMKWVFGKHEFFGPNPLAYPKIDGSGRAIAWMHDLFGISVVPKDLIVLGTTAAALVLVQVFVRYSRMGKAMRAVSISYDSARLMGININAVISFTFVLGSMLAALGGCLWGLNSGQCVPLMGIIPGLKAFVAAVIGGIGNIPGAAAGAFLLAIIETVVTSITINHSAVAAPYKDAVAFLILILVLLIRPEGIFGKAVPEKV